MNRKDAPNPEHGLTGGGGTAGQDDDFLRRWSRRKKEAREAPLQPAVQAPPPAPVDEQPPQLPAIDTLTLESDFSGFFHPKVGETVRRAALRKLFSDPHFNVMDGLDTYIDDYSKSDPIPPAMLAGLKQAQRILKWAEGKDDEEMRAAHADADELPPPGSSPEPQPVPALAQAPADADGAAHAEPIPRAADVPNADHAASVREAASE